MQYCKSDPGCSDVWGGDGGFTASYINGRKQNSNELYDAAGNIVDKTTSATIYERWKFDAAGRNLETKMRWYWQPASQSTSFDRTEIITQTRDGDGRVVKRIDHKEGTQLPNNTTTIGETSEYYVNSTVIGNVLTELDASGAKKATNIFTGKGILAEQRNFPPDAVHPQPWSEVFWNHQDIITGSYSKVTRGGTELNVYDPPSKAEIEPLGAAVPTNDPNISDEAYEPRHLRTFAFAGDVNRPEYGCAQDGAPIPCNMLGQVLSGARSFQMEINTRFSGGWDAYYGLRASISVWHYRKSVPLPDICLGEQCSTSNVSAKHTRTWVVVKEWDEVYVAPFWELLAPQTQRNASGGGEGLNQCGKGKPCPKLTPPPPPPPTPCAKMAARAQKVASENIGNSSPLKSFDFNFNTLYIGHVVDGSFASAKYFNWDTKGGVNSSSAGEQGQHDFQDRFIDDDFSRDDTRRGADQVHHFAFYFSAGINGANLSSYFGELSDGSIGRPVKGANTGDQNLAVSAFELGKKLKNDQTLLKSVGELIKNEICK